MCATVARYFCLFCSLLLLVSACSQEATNPPAGRYSPIRGASATVPASSSPASTPTPASLSKDCPAPGTGRAARVDAIATGHSPELVSLISNDPVSTLQPYDIA